jgi:catechol 2,3-dioxygenase-like lactoylglutathione lyase family enzyme
MKPRISMITLGVSDLAAAVKFYELGLGFPRMESPPEVAFFTLDGTWLGLYPREALAEDASVSSEGAGFRGFTLSHNVASEREVDAVLVQAVAAGATLQYGVLDISGSVEFNEICVNDSVTGTQEFCFIFLTEISIAQGHSVLFFPLFITLWVNSPV